MSEALIAALAADMRPVRRLRSPGVRAAGWLLVVGALGVALAAVSDLGAVRTRLEALPDLRWATVGSVLTAIAAAYAAFQASVPGRARAWAWLPVVPAALWLGSSGLGCLRGWGMPGLVPATMNDAMGCAAFITLVSVPLSAVLVIMVRRACPLWPGRVAALGGLAAAAAAASLLTLFHPHDASAADLALHLAAVGVVVLGTRLAGAAGA